MTDTALWEMRKMNTAEEQIYCQDFHELSYIALVLFVFSINMKANLR